ncbi:hypothetical protein KAU19_05750 [Candidatus Parcubacteria bacterium]|nr:hypothetical protein [Candidatus Parcubacteria bacterium]
MSNKKALNQYYFSVRISIISAAVIVAVGLLFSADFAKADYYNQGILKSTNVLSGATVSAISGFSVTSSMGATASTSAQFSQDRVNFYDSSGVEGAWDSCSDGTTNIDISGLGWSGGILFYKLKLETSDAPTTPTVTNIQVDYTGTEVPAPSGNDYYSKGTLVSENILSGAEVSAINSFIATSSIPGGASVSVQFSQDKVNFYSSSGVKWAWDSCSDGTTNIDLSGLGWSGALFYKFKLETIDNEQTPSITEIQVDYDGTEVPAPSGNSYPPEGFLVSTNLLDGMKINFNGTEKFGYNITFLPSGTAVYAQFSQDSVNWYSSTSTKWAWDILSAGNHLERLNALDLSGLGWSGDNFYYKLKFTTIDSRQTPIIDEINLLRKSTVVNAPLTNKFTDGLVGYWSFDGQDMDWASSTAEALDRSGNSNNGDVKNGATPAIGKVGQGLEFDGTDDYVDCGDVYNGIKTISFWIKAGSLTEKIIDLNGTANIEVINGTITANNFSPTVYVDGVLASTIDTDWHYIIIATSTGINASAVDIGRIGAGYFGGILDEVRIYNYALSADEILKHYRVWSRTMKIDPTKPYKTIIKQ